MKWTAILLVTAIVLATGCSKTKSEDAVNNKVVNGYEQIGGKQASSMEKCEPSELNKKIQFIILSDITGYRIYSYKFKPSKKYVTIQSREGSRRKDGKMPEQGAGTTSEYKPGETIIITFVLKLTQPYYFKMYTMPESGKGFSGSSGITSGAFQRMPVGEDVVESSGDMITPTETGFETELFSRIKRAKDAPSPDGNDPNWWRFVLEVKQFDENPFPSNPIEKK